MKLFMFCIFFYNYRPPRYFVCDAAINFKIAWPHTPSGTPSNKISAVDAIGQESHIMSNEEKTGNRPFWKNTGFEIL